MKMEYEARFFLIKIKKMPLKIFFLAVLFSLFCSNKTYAQRFEIGAYYGIGYPLIDIVKTKYSIDGMGPNIPPQVISLHEALSNALGYNSSRGISIGYSLNNHINVELDYLHLTTYGFEYLNGYFNGGRGGGGLGNFYFKYDVSAKFSRISPMVVFKTSPGKIDSYLKVGALMNFNADMISNFYYGFDALPLRDSATSTHFYNGISFGLNTSLGLDVKLFHHFYAFGELVFNFINWSPSHSEITAYSNNGQDKLSSLTTSQRETDYVSNPGYYNSNQPTQAAKQHFDISNFGFNVGLKYSFEKKKEETKSK